MLVLTDECAYDRYARNTHIYASTGLKQLLTKNRSLTQLNLGLCGIGPAGLKELCSTLHKNTTLIALQLAGNTFDLQSVEALGKVAAA